MGVLLIFLILGGSIVAGWIKGLTVCSKLPMPPADLSPEDYKQYYCDMLWQQESDRLHNKKNLRKQ